MTTRERIRGCLLGGAVGDALGAPVEFKSRAEIEVRFGADGIRDFAAAFGLIGAITDDTQMTLFTAEGLMRAQNRAFSRGICDTPAVVWNAYLRWLRTQTQGLPRPSSSQDSEPDGWLIEVADLYAERAPGNTCLRALRSGVMGTIEQPINDSKGCGGVMRVAPAGILAPVNPFDDACELAAITHGHPAGYLSAGFLAGLIARLLDGTELDRAAELTYLELAERVGSSGTDEERRRAAECQQAVQGALSLAAADNEPSLQHVQQLGEGWVAEEALAISLYCALTAGSFEEGVVCAVNHGGDSDSTGAITGNILGTALGERAIPERWLDELELRPTIEAVADDLARHRSKECYGGTDADIPDEEWRRYPGW